MELFQIIIDIWNSLWRVVTGDPVFFVLGLIILVMALFAVNSTNLVKSCLCLLGAFGSIALLYFYLGAYFVGIAQVLIYAVGITLIILFAVMLMSNAAERDLPLDNSDKTNSFNIFAAFASLGVFGLISYAIANSQSQLASLVTSIAILKEQAIDQSATNDIVNIGERLFTEQLVSFELISFALLVAFVAAIIIARREVTQ